MSKANTSKTAHKTGDLVYVRFEMGAGMEHMGYKTARSLVTKVTGKGEAARFGVVPIEPAGRDHYYFCVDRGHDSPYFLDKPKTAVGQLYNLGTVLDVEYSLSLAGGPSGMTHTTKSVVVKVKRQERTHFNYVVLPLEPAPDDMAYHFAINPALVLIGA